MAYKKIGKNLIYKQIDDFNEHITDEIETRTKRFFYVNRKLAEDRAKFFGFIIKEKKLNNFNKVIDLTFGSGNLTAHLLLDNDIKYKTLTLNDINNINSNQSIKLKNVKFTINDVTNQSSFTNKNDLIIFNPPIGNVKVAFRIVVTEKTKNFDNMFDTIKKVLTENNILIFYGELKNFDLIIDRNYYYIRYITDDDGADLFLLSKSFDENICYEKTNDEFVINKECKKIKQEETKENISLYELDKKLTDSIEKMHKASIGGIWGSDDNKENDKKDEEVAKKDNPQDKTKPKKKFRNFLKDYYKGDK